ncbi:hypothetical protein GCM10010520_51480 [Rhizobium viscosum]
MGWKAPAPPGLGWHRMWRAPALRKIGFVMQRISSAVVCPAFDAAIYRLLALKGSARIVPPID